VLEPSRPGSGDAAPWNLSVAHGPPLPRPSAARALPRPRRRRGAARRRARHVGQSRERDALRDDDQANILRGRPRGAFVRRVVDPDALLDPAGASGVDGSGQDVEVLPSTRRGDATVAGRLVERIDDTDGHWTSLDRRSGAGPQALRAGVVRNRHVSRAPGSSSCRGGEHPHVSGKQLPGRMRRASRARSYGSWFLGVGPVRASSRRLPRGAGWPAKARKTRTSARSREPPRRTRPLPTRGPRGAPIGAPPGRR
jgi:hypothetical protein